jgi:hypothetical protein
MLGTSQPVEITIYLYLEPEVLDVPDSTSAKNGVGLIKEIALDASCSWHPWA